MLEFSWFVCGIISFLVHCYLFEKVIYSKKFHIDLYKILLSFIISIGYFELTKYNLIYVRPFIINFLILLGLILLYRFDLILTIVIQLSIFIGLSISELLYGFILLFVVHINTENFINCWCGYIVTNVFIHLICIFLFSIPGIKGIIMSIIDAHKKNRFIFLVIFIVSTMILFTFFLYNNLIAVLPRQLLWVTNIFSVAVIFFVISYFKEKSSNNRIIDEYDQLLGYVKKYEKVVEEKSKNQHEYKNQLVMLKSMINKSNKKAINYIESLYDDSKDDENIELLKKLKYLPSGGLKGLIYYKIEEMQENDIKVFVDISSQLKNIKINKKIDKNLKDISKVIGVYMDNAIEATINSKEKFIILEVYLNNEELVFSLSNTYSNKLDLSLIDKEGYTTKGDGKGYGLSLVKDIIAHNRELRQEKELNGIYYTQRLYMKK